MRKIPAQRSIPTNQHTKHSWEANSLMKDFLLEDAWQFPVVLQPHHTLEEFRDQMKLAMEELTESGLAGVLFKVRLFVGNIFGWDNKPKVLKESVGSLRSRYARSFGIQMNELPQLTGEDFEPVYILPNESLAEIDNATVHAALHLGKVPLGEGTFTIQMGVYVKPKGLFGKLYMSAIKGARHWVVYPTLLKKVGQKWKSYDEGQVMA